MGITITELPVMIPAGVDTPYKMQKIPSAVITTGWIPRRYGPW